MAGFFRPATPISAASKGHQIKTNFFLTPAHEHDPYPFETVTRMVEVAQEHIKGMRILETMLNLEGLETSKQRQRNIAFCRDETEGLLKTAVEELQNYGNGSMAAYVKCHDAYAMAVSRHRRARQSAWKTE